jgi:DNA-binding winged helix-turn-helix (wHTH) protein
VFDLLVYLLQNRHRVVSKDDLIATVWGGQIVSDSTLANRINAARKAVGDSGDEQRLIRTVARKGVRFIGEVRMLADGGSPAHANGVASRQSNAGVAACHRPIGRRSLYCPSQI